jgi:DNA invertase Pin-like site-specific DNA recombinase
MACIGCARVSTLDRELDGQRARLETEGCAVIRSEKV